MDIVCAHCGSPIPAPADRRTVPPSRKYCGRPCYDAARPPAPLAERFWKYVQRGEGCWEWQAARNKLGYGAFGLDRDRMTPAHRFSWELHFGVIPPGLLVCHHCDNPPCVRPDHLFLGTYLANVRDMDRKGRRVIGRRFLGEANAQSKLTDNSVRIIRARAAAGETNRAIAADFGVSAVLVSRVVRRKGWRHVA